MARKNTHQVLEAVLKIIALPILVFIFLLFTQRNMTGNAININESFYPVLTIPAIILGGIIIFIAVKSIRNNI
jgi:hypothetical protein